MDFWKTRWNDNQQALQKYEACISTGAAKAEELARPLREYDLSALQDLSALSEEECDALMAAEEGKDGAECVVDWEYQRRLVCNSYYLGFLRAARFLEPKKPLDAKNAFPMGWVTERGTEAIKPNNREIEFFPAEDPEEVLA